ncbi:MAG: phosphatase domain-containing protein, partial [Bacteroidota bacterium]
MPSFNFISRLIDNRDPVIIMPFGGYANQARLFTCARVLEDEGIRHHEDDHKLKNLWNSFKRFESDEIGGATVVVSWADKHVTLTTDKEGYVILDTAHGLDLTNWNEPTFLITYQLIVKGRTIYQTNTSIHLPSPGASFGVISDVDDTILQTGVTSTLKWRVLVNVLTKHSHQRLPLEGAEVLYEQLHKGRTGNERNPFFYLSNSPWNIFDYLTAFLEKFEFPPGPLLLRDINGDFLKKSGFEKGHKYLSIVHILQMYPSLNFILIGDA